MWFEAQKKNKANGKREEAKKIKEKVEKFMKEQERQE